MTNGIYLWHDQYLANDFGGDHPFKPEKFKVFRELLKQQQVDISEIQVPRSFTITELKTIFKPEFIEDLLRKENEQGAMLDPGTPAFKNMVEISSIACYGTYYALKELLDEKITFAFNCLGGLHHGMRDTSAGGCILNDMGYTIELLRKQGYEQKIAIVDVDFHPHNGTVEFLKDDERVLMASIHEQGWFGFEDDLYDGLYNNVVNIPIKSTYNLTEEEYLELFDQKIIPAVRSFQPDIIIYVNGADGHKEDEVTYYGRKTKPISLTDQTYKILAEKMSKLALELTNGRIVGLGAGGYSIKHSANVWCITVKAFVKLLG